MDIHPGRSARTGMSMGLECTRVGIRDGVVESYVPYPGSVRVLRAMYMSADSLTLIPDDTRRQGNHVVGHPE